MAFRPESTLNPKTLRREAIQLAIVAVVSIGLYFTGVRALQIVVGVIDMFACVITRDRSDRRVARRRTRSFGRALCDRGAGVRRDRDPELRLAPRAPLVLGHQPPGAALGDDALHVRVPPLRHVTLGSDERMLARRVQHRVAERAHVARRLEALRGTQSSTSGLP